MSENTDNFDFKEEYGEKLMDHDYDGIKELDNPAPKWVMAIFYITIAISVFYAVYYFILDGPSQDEEYLISSALHDEEYASSEGDNLTLELLSDEKSLAEGKALYSTMNCATCHGAAGEGNVIGPNLTDNAWINGCDFNSVFDIIKNGKPNEGMTAFKTQMTDLKIQQITSYLLKDLLASNPDNAKEAEGTVCE